MIGGRRWVMTAAAVAVAGGTTGIVVAASRWQEGRFERTGALRIAATTAAYLAVVIPAAADSTDFDLPKLLVQARALTTLPGRTSAVEVYHGTAPLVDATAPPLPATELASLRGEAGGDWRDGRALTPLIDPGSHEVVGAVAIRAAGGGPAALLLRWALPAGVLAVVVAAGAAVGRRPLRQYTGAALLLGLAAYADVRGAARRATDRWLVETRLLLQEAATRLPTPRARVTLGALAPLTGNAELVAADSAGPAPRRVRVAGERYAVVAARLGAGRWVQVRTEPGEAFTMGWLVLLVGVALSGPLALRGLRWVEQAARRRRELHETAAAWGFLAPAGLHLALFSFGPLLFALYLSLRESGVGLATRVEPPLGSFAAVLRDPLVWVALRNTILYSLYVPVSVAIALAVALVLNRAGGWGGGARRTARFLRAALLLPYVASVVAVALVWQWMYHPDFGLFNYLLSFMGVGPYDWLGRSRTALIAVMLLSIWAQVGYQIAVFLAGLESIPKAYVDAARVDGATAWQRFRRITLPLLRPVTLFVLVTGVIGAFQVFTYVYVLTRGGPLHATDVAVHRIYQTAWELQQFGPASALSLCLYLILFGATWAQFRLLGRRVEYA
jgi:multiple sugar transport system permease protein